MFDRQAVLTATTSIVLGAGLVLAICANASAAVRPAPISTITSQIRIQSECNRKHYVNCLACCRAYKEQGHECHCGH